MLPLALFPFILAPVLSAADDPNRAVEIALANTLHSGDATALAQLFDPKMPSWSRLHSDLEELLKDGEVSLQIDSTTGVWTLDITSRDLAAGVTERKAKVSLETAAGRIESLTPADFLAPPHGRAAWDAVFAFATSLNDDQAAPTLAQFDPAMPGLAALKTAITELWTRYQINTSLDLQSNEGDDVHRTLRIAWTQTLKNQQDPVDSHRTEQTVECRLEKETSRKKPWEAWRIVSFSPSTLFDPPASIKR